MPTIENRFQHPVITEELLIRAIDAIPARLHGLHGIPHWLRVERNGLILAQSERADARVVSLFALLHDSRRINDDADPDHGPRAAILARQLHAEGLLPIDETQLSQLAYACEHHTDEIHTGDITIACCWDADRLDLIRCGVEPDPEYLNTGTAIDIARGKLHELIREVSFGQESPPAMMEKEPAGIEPRGIQPITWNWRHGVLQLITVASFLLSLLICALALVMLGNFNFEHDWHGWVMLATFAAPVLVLIGRWIWKWRPSPATLVIRLLLSAAPFGAWWFWGQEGARGLIH